MSAVKTPTSSLTASELLFNQLWYRTKAKIKRLFLWLFCGCTPEAVSMECSSPITKLPQELVEVIIAYFIYDMCSLLACSMTCYSWYIAATPHLHHSLTTDDYYSCLNDEKYFWPRSLRKSHKLGLLPLVKRFRIRLGSIPYHSRDIGFGPKRLSRCTLHYFSALTNLQELGIDHLQVSSFMPTIRQCFGHLSPTLRFLALKEPNGSCRQILYFIGLFPNLQDLKLHYRLPMYEQESTADATLVPLSTPPLQGWLTLTCFTRENLMRDMILLFGGLRFRCMDLFRVKCARLLLGACTRTLETLRLYPTDPYANDCALHRHFNLSQNKSLRALETTAESIINADNTASDFLGTVLSSITSPAPLEVVIIYRAPIFWGSTQKLQQQLRVFHKMHNTMDFRLVLCADVSDHMVEYAIKRLEHTVKAEKGLGHLLFEPLIIAERRTLRTRRTDRHAGMSDKYAISGSAL